MAHADYDPSDVRIRIRVVDDERKRTEEGGAVVISCVRSKVQKSKH